MLIDDLVNSNFESVNDNLKQIFLVDADFFDINTASKYLVPDGVDYTLYKEENAWVCEIKRSPFSRTVLASHKSCEENVARVGAYLKWRANGGL
jgi:hypothetical protein